MTSVAGMKLFYDFIVENQAALALFLTESMLLVTH